MIPFPIPNARLSGRFFWLLFLFVALCFGGATTARAQDDDTIRTDTSVVQLNVGVVDRQGHVIRSLSRNDFAVYEDGMRQTIQSFEPAEAPFSLVMLLQKAFARNCSSRPNAFWMRWGPTIAFR